MHQALKLGRQYKEQQQDGNHQHTAKLLNHLAVTEVRTAKADVKAVILANHLLYPIHSITRLASLKVQFKRIEFSIHSTCYLLQITVTGLLEQYLQWHAPAAGLNVTALDKVLGLLCAHANHYRHGEITLAYTQHGTGVHGVLQI